MKKSFYVYIVTNATKSVLYTGITNDIKQRVVEHYLNRVGTDTFTGRYKAYYLLYYETFDYPLQAIAREKEIKGWRREKKLNLIKTENPKMTFLNYTLYDKWPPDNMFHRKDL